MHWIPLVIFVIVLSTIPNVNGSYSSDLVSSETSSTYGSSYSRNGYSSSLNPYYGSGSYYSPMMGGLGYGSGSYYSPFMSNLGYGTGGFGSAFGYGSMYRPYYGGYSSYSNYRPYYNSYTSNYLPYSGGLNGGYGYSNRCLGLYRSGCNSYYKK